jgi:hypothetical protein
MTDERKGGIALIASSAALLATMALHPLPHEGAAMWRGVAVHVLAILASPVALFGAAILSRRVKAQLATYFQTCALIVGMFAPIMSGLIAPMAPSPEVARFAWALNQACTRIWGAGAAIAFVLWGLASWRDRLLPRLLAIYGFACAVVVLAIVFLGIPLDVHHVGLVALLEAGFSIWAGVIMVRSGSAWA